MWLVLACPERLGKASVAGRLVNLVLTSVVKLWTRDEGAGFGNQAKSLIFRQAMRGAYGCHEDTASGMPFLQLRRCYQIAKDRTTSRANRLGYAA
jgi:hypothetical protein